MASTELERLAASLCTDAACAEEPIRIPGNIQPHGLLLVVDAATLTIRQVSANAPLWLGADPDVLLGAPLSSLLEDGAEWLADRLAQLDTDNRRPVHLGEYVLGAAAARQRVACSAHRVDGGYILECEPPESATLHQVDLSALIHRFVARLGYDATIEQLCQLAAAELKRITGFGRVKAYCFDVAGNGRVLAEVADEGYPSYLGLCFPASDIPAQARQLYLSNRIRLIPDVDYQPCALVPPLNPRDGRPLDLSFAALRSVSPVHVQYMKNMGTRAALSVSIVVQDRLWGMISCHDSRPRLLGPHTRTACELLGQVLSLQVEARELHALTGRQLRLRELIVRMLSAMADEDSVGAGLHSVPEVFLEFAGASGGALVWGERIELIGKTPSAAAVHALVQRLDRLPGQPEVFHTDKLARDLPGLDGLEDMAGVLAVSISELHPHYLIWFRPETVRTVNWAGCPGKVLDERGLLNPRSSFESWQEVARGACAPWESVEIEAAHELRAAVLGIVLRKAEELAELTGELTRSNKELEAFSYSVSHDLRAPLRHIAGYAELLSDFEGEKLSERGLRFLTNIGDSARFAGTLVDNLLTFSQMGRAALRHSDVNLEALVSAIRQEMAPDYAGRSIEWRIGVLPVVIADAAFIHLALRNLLGNAIKYTRDRAPAIIEVGSAVEDKRTVVFVRDNGVGFDMAYVGKLFGIFQRLHHVDEFEGTGIGLASVRRIIERHDGEVWAEGAPGQGATFYFSLPRLTYTPLT